MNTSVAKKLSSLYTHYNVSIRDPLWKDIHLSEELKRIYLTPLVQKLGRIKQLGPTFHLYPGAVHTRLDHSLGVYHISYTILTNLLKQALSKGEETILSEEGMRTFLCAALLHDIGHFPFAHSLKELPLRSHEAIAASLIKEDRQLHDAIVESGCSPALVAAIIDESLPNSDAEIQFYRSLLSGALDPDKLDYLNRDAFFCGVPYGMQDVSFITNHLMIFNGKPALPLSAAGSVEHLLFSKYLMYKNVYWHKRVRSATAMIKKALLSSLMEGILTPDDLYVLDDEQFFMLGDRLAYKPLSLFSQVRDNSMLSCRFEKDFDEEHPFDRLASSLQGRLVLEENLWHKLSKKYKGLESYQVIIDIPEPIMFESDIPLIQSDGVAIAFNRADTVFSQDVGKVFTKNLRKTRIFTPSYVTQEALFEALES
ncbi:MAG TPA: HD domain-containing protein [Sphaerochaeta sp.]|nr:HD domain-containing protein [Sphaerochaeta sp.]